MPREWHGRQLIGSLGYFSATRGLKITLLFRHCLVFHLSALAQALQWLPLKVSCLT